MSGKNHKKLRRQGADRKTSNQFNETKVTLLDRDSLFVVLELFHHKFIRKEAAGWDDFVRESVTKSTFSPHNGKDSLIKKIINFQPCYHTRTDYPAIPISIFHIEKTDKILFSFTRVDELYRLTHGLRIMKSESNEIIEEHSCPKTFSGITPFNTFQLELDLNLLHEILPSSRADLDQLIKLGQLDEQFSPLNAEELVPFMEMKTHDPDAWKRIYKDELAVIHTSQGTFYQPQKTRTAWSKNVISVPVKFTMKNGRPGCFIPMYASNPMHTIFN
jgi:hypothetical protein